MPSLERDHQISSKKKDGEEPFCLWNYLIPVLTCLANYFLNLTLTGYYKERGAAVESFNNLQL